jgi:hypothetical protein
MSTVNLGEMRLTDFESGTSIIMSPSFFTIIMSTKKINLNLTAVVFSGQGLLRL